MAKRSRSKSSSSELLSDIPEEERVNDQVNDEEPEAVSRAGEDSETEDQDGEEDNDEEENELQEEDDAGANETAKPEKATLKEMQRLKEGKAQEVLEAQNAAIDADMVESIGSSSFSGDLNDNFESEDQSSGENNAGEPSIGRKKAKKLLNQEFNQFLISMKAQNEQIKKNAPTNS
nr:ISWI chromatin-remodeling complex ATPase CHR11 [Ipomoea batatas]